MFVIIQKSAFKLLAAHAGVQPSHQHATTGSSDIMPAQQLMSAISHALQEDEVAALAAASAEHSEQPMLQNLPLTHDKTPSQSADIAAAHTAVAVSLHTSDNSVVLELTPVRGNLLPAAAGPSLPCNANVSDAVSVHRPTQQSIPHAAGASGLQIPLQTRVTPTQRDAVHDIPTAPLLDSQGQPLLDTQGPPLLDTQGPPLLDTQGPPLLDTQGPPLLDTQGPPLLDTQGPPSTRTQVRMWSTMLHDPHCSISLTLGVGGCYLHGLLRMDMAVTLLT